METIRKHLLRFGLIIFCWLFFNSAFASHVAGGYIQFICTGTPGVYTVRMVLYRDCSGSTLGTGTKWVDLTNSCVGGSIDVGLTYVNSFEVSQVCAADQNNTTCNGGSIPGYEQYIFEATVNLGDCDHWTAAYSLCCRNGTTNMNGQPTFAITSDVYTATDNCNTSPQVTAQPEPYVCLGQPVSYNLGAFEPDGDSIVYSFSNPNSANGYQTGYSANDPIGGANLDVNSGTVTFVPNTQGNFIFVITMTEYNDNGDIVNVTNYEYQTTVINCSNQTPEPPDANGGAGVTGITGSIIKNGPTSLTLCKDNSGCFDVVFTDPDAGQSLSITSNISAVLPGATVTQTGSNPLTVNVCYTPTNTSGIKTLSFLVEDDACPLTGQNNFAMTINVVDPGTADVTTTTEICGGTNQGTATVSVVGGAGPYTYSITGPVNDASTQTTNASYQFTNLAPGSYTYTVSTPEGCDLTGTFTIVAGPDLVATTASTDVLCNGESNGSATITPTSGSAPYNYVWSQGGNPIGQTTQTASNLAAGTYDVIATDYDGCTVTQTITVAEPAALAGTLTPTDALCNGAGNGVIDVTGVTGGVPDYHYSLDGAAFQNGASFTGVSTGPHQVEIKDDKGCTLILNTTIAEPTPLTITIVSTDDATCGSPTGSFEVSASGGTSTPAYQYSMGGASQGSGLFTNVAAGSHNVTVTDGNGCTATINVVVGSVTSPVASIDNIQDISCFGGNNGEVIIGTTNAPAPVSYSLDGALGQPSNMFTNITPGNHTVVVTDGNGCATSINFTISQPTVLQFTSAITDASCLGTCDGEIAVSATGGVSPYQYSSNNGLTFGTNATLAGLCAGNVDVVVKDDHGCITNATVTINQPTELTATFILTDPTCRDGNDGQIVANPIGGSGSFQYGVDGGTLQGSNTLTGLGAGNHLVTIQDLNGCALDTVLLLNNPPGIIVDTLFMHPSSCGFASGDISFTANGPNPIVNYTLTNSGIPPVNITNSTGAFTNLVAGAYKIYVTDNKGCVDSSFYGINDVEMDGAILNMQNISCYDGSDGLIEVENTYGKGTNPITFELDNSGIVTLGTPYNNADPYSNYHYTQTGLEAGSHIITMYDAGNCIYTFPFTLTEPDSISFDELITDASCYGGSDGKIEVTNVTGGTGAYQYAEGGGFFVTYGPSNEFPNLAAGDYIINVKDDNDCVQTHNVSVGEAPLITFSVNVSDLVCHNDNTGAFQVVATGGTGTFQYSNDGGINFQTINAFAGLAAGNYNVVVKDVNGCQVDSIIVINQPDTIQATYSTADALCFGASDGKIGVAAIGGTPLYTYSADNGITMTSNDTIFNLPAGTYTVYIEDDNGCVITSTQVINEPTQVTLTADTVPSTCGNPNGEIHITPGGGTPAYTFSIDGGTTFANSDDFVGLPAGNYNLAVRDDHGCVVNGGIEITNMPSPQINILLGTDPLCNGDVNGEIEVTAIGGTGTLQYSVNGGGFQTSNILTGLSAGTHTVVVTDINGCTDSKTISLNEPSALTMNTVLTDLQCFENSTGKIQVAASGGTPTYQYSFDNGLTYGASPIANFIAAGSYDVIVKDIHGCLVTSTVILTEPPALVINNMVLTDALCKSSTDGQAQVTTSGGTVPYTYQWNDPANQITATATNLGAGTYQVIVEDDHGCTLDSTITINEPDSVQIASMDITNVTCNGDADGQLVIHSPTGTQFSIDGGITFQSSNTFTGLAAADYNIQVQDVNGCIVNRIANIWEAAPVTLTISNDTTVCYAYNATLVGMPDGGIQPYTYQWSGGTSNDSLQIVATQTNSYSLQVFDYNGCPSTVENATITVLPQVDINVLVDTVICPGGTATLTATGLDGLPGYTYDWSNGETTNSIAVSPEVTTTYTATVTDQCNQQAAASVVVDIHDLPLPILEADDTVGCLPLTTNFTNLTNPINIGSSVWTINGDTYTDPTNLQYTFDEAGCYDVTLQVTSPFGCVNDTTYEDYICVDAYPVADFTYLPENPTILHNQVNINNYTIGAETYSWTFQGEGTSSDENPSVIFSHVKENTKVDICLVAYSLYGCADTICKSLELKSEFNVYVPNTFTPDDDQYNPVFLPVFPPDVAIEKYHLTIFNRWGEILFESYNYKVGWNGTYGGNIVKDGTYIWKIKVKEEGNNKKTREFVGHVTLLK